LAVSGYKLLCVQNANKSRSKRRKLQRAERSIGSGGGGENVFVGIDHTRAKRVDTKSGRDNK